MPRLPALAALAAAAILAAPAHADEPPRYQYAIIGGVPHPSGSLASALPLALNNNGRMVGYTASGPGAFQPMNWRSGVSMTLGGAASYDRAFASRVNILGRVVGAGYTLDGNGGILESHALRWTGGAVANLGSLGGRHAVAMGIDDSGRIVGYSTTLGETQTRAFLYQDGEMAPLQTLPGAIESYAYDIANSGYIAGAAVTSVPSRPFVARNGVVTQLPIPDDARAGAASAVNDSGHAVGTVELNLATGSFAAILWQGGQMVNLGYLGGEVPYATAADINSSGQVVGTTATTEGRTGFLWHRGTMYDIRSLLLDGPESLQITAASAINDSGQIAAAALINGIQAAVLLSPIVPGVPAPGALTLLAAAGLFAAWRKR